MKTPICGFVNEYKKSGKLRLHMPGHKGKDFLGIESFDITEISGADVLYDANGIIRKSEENAAKLFGTKKTVYSAEGSSLSIRAMLYLAMLHAKETDRKPIIAAGRNAHRVFMTAAALLDFEIAWIFPEKEESIISCDISPEYLDEFLSEAEEKPVAVYITSPDYLGGIADIKGISEVCRKHSIPLLVDNAHGAYLAFCEKNLHPIAVGADMCCDSAHKTLPVLTGGSYLHCAKSDMFGFSESIKAATAVFGSTSPSYLIMQSLDLCNIYIDEKIREDIVACTAKVNEIREIMKANGIEDISAEPLKIAAVYHDADYFRSYGIEPEYADGEYVVFMFSPFNSDNDFERITKAFLNIPKTDNRNSGINFVKSESAVSIREALFAESEEIDIDDAVGRICAAPAVSCPPAIPIVISGEVITEAHRDLFKTYSIEKVAVIKEAR